MTKTIVYSNPMPTLASMPSPFSYAARIPASSFSAPVHNEAFRVFLEGAGGTAKDLNISEPASGLSQVAPQRLIKLNDQTQFVIPAAGVWSDPIPFPFNVAVDAIFAMDGVSGSYKRNLSLAGYLYGYKSGNGHALNPDKSTFITTGLANTSMTIGKIEVGTLDDFGLGEGGEPEEPEEPNPPAEECTCIKKLSDIDAGQWFASAVTREGQPVAHTCFQIHNDTGKDVLIHTAEITFDADCHARIAINSSGGILPTAFGAPNCNLKSGGASATVQRRTGYPTSLPTGTHARVDLSGGHPYKFVADYLLKAGMNWGLIVAAEEQNVGGTVNFTWREIP